MTDEHSTILDVPSFWQWLFLKDSEGDRGIENLADLWNLGGLALALGAAFFLSVQADFVARAVALPASAIFIGISFAWAGRSAGLLHDAQFSQFIVNFGPPAEGYLYSFQLAILTVIALVLLAVALSAKVYLVDLGSSVLNNGANLFILIFLSLVAARECWGAISFANKLSIQFYRMRQLESEAQN